MKLKPAQREALEFIEPLYGAALFMDMGLGKTLVALLRGLDLYAAKLIEHVIVVSPNSFKSGWVDEIRKHELNAYEPFVYEAREKNQHNQWLSVIGKHEGLPITIINYESIRGGDGRSFLEHIVHHHCGNALIVFDESIQVKGHNTLQTKSAIMLAKNCSYKLVLTGKPIVQGPHDLWGQLRAIGELEGFNYFVFRNSFCKMGGFQYKQVVGARNEDVLAEMTAPYVFRASKDDYFDIDKLYTTIDCDLGPVLKKYYKEMHEDFVVWYSDNDHVAVDIALAKYAKLQQIQCGFIINEEQKAIDLVPLDKNPRIKAIKMLVEEQFDGKFAVPYYNVHAFDLLAEALKKHGLAWIKGGMSPDEVSEQKARFNDDKDVRGILLQTRAGKYGHTLLGDQETVSSSCRNMAFFQNTYSLDDRSQVEDRIHREGQHHACNYTDIASSPIDKAMAVALQRKLDLGAAFDAALKQYSRMGDV